MTRWTLCAAIAAALVAAPATAAVTLDPGGLGQGLLFPYFSTNNGQSTLVTVQNTSAEGKALKLRVLESYAGAETLTFNLYLAPGGIWNAALTQVDHEAGAFATLLRGGDNCTVPMVPDEGFDLRPFAFEGDDGPQTGERSREGYIEIVEMGTLSAALTEATRNPTVANCMPFNERFSNGGIWTTQPNADLSAPTGGLRGGAVLIDTADGTSFNYPALAFDGLAIAPRQYSVAFPNTDYALPRLTDVQVAEGEDIEVNLIDATGTPVTLRYDAIEGYNAISALLANHAANSAFNVDAGLRARSEWIYSFPTRRAHNASIVVGTPPPQGVTAPPFAGTTADCETVQVTLADRNGSTGENEALELCGAAGTVRFAADGLDTAPILALDDDPLIEAPFAAGTATFDFSQFGDDPRSSLPDLDGRCFTGLPVWAMAVSAYDNDNAQAGRIATFPVEEVASRVTNIIDCSND